VERGSDKVAPRIDEELEKETGPLQRGAPVSSRAEEFREQEGSGEDEPGTDTRLTITPTEARVDLARHLQPSVFPASRDDLLRSAREMHAPEGIIEVLDQLPDGRKYGTLQEVWEAVAGPEA
jgi:hypothetical protein